MEVARGNVNDRPFARTIYTLLAKQFTGDLVLVYQSRNYRTSWENGLVVAADSPSPADTPGRVAMTAGLVNSTALRTALRDLTNAPSKNLLDLIVQHGRLNDQERIHLKRLTLAHGAARMFALAGADYIIDDTRTLMADAEVAPFDPRWLIYFGARTHCPAERLRAELDRVANRGLQIAQDALPSLEAFGFHDIEAPVLQRLREREYTVDGLCASSAELEPHSILAVVYALLACDCLNVGEERPRSATLNPLTGIRHSRPTSQPPLATRERRDSIPTRPRAPTGSIPPGSQPNSPRRAIPVAEPTQPNAPKEMAMATGSRAHDATDETTPSHYARDDGSLALTGQSNKAQHTRETLRRRRRRTSATVFETRGLISTKLKELDDDATYYTLLDVKQGMAEKDIRVSYFELAKQLHPDRLRALGIMDKASDAQRLFAAINQAFSTLSSSEKRKEYDRVLMSGGAKAVADAQRKAEEKAQRVLAAEEHYRIGEMALRRSQYQTAKSEFEKSIDLNPEEGDYYALWAWAEWCTSENKEVILPSVIDGLNTAKKLAPQSVEPFYYRGKVLGQLGRTDEALKCFRMVLNLRPGHHEAELELRVLSRQKTRTDGTGLFGRKKR